MTTRSSSARLRSILRLRRQHIGEKGSRRTLKRTKDYVSKVPFRHFLFGQAPLRDPTAFRDRSLGQPRPQNAQPPTPPPSALLLMPQPLGKRTNHALSSGIPTLHLPPENYSSSNLASIPRRKHSQSSYFITQLIAHHCPRSRRSQEDRRSAPATGRSTPHTIHFFRCSHIELSK